MLGRRFVLAAFAAGAGGLARRADAQAVVPIKLGLLQFGTIQWLADLVRRQHLDEAHGFALQPVVLANNDAGRIALMAGSADIILTDWLFAAKQRQAGTALSFASFSSAAGGVIVPSSSPVRSLPDLHGRKLGVAGGPLDRSWLLVQAAARANGTDLARAAQIVYGAPPLLSAKLQQGELDAALTFWTFAARLEAAGFREAVSVDDCAVKLGLPAELGLLGFVFRTEWAERNRAAVNGFLAAFDAAQSMLLPTAPGADAQWAQLRPLMELPAGPERDVEFLRLRERFLAGLRKPPAAEQEQVAERVLNVLRQTGGSRATEGLEAIPAGLFWQAHV